MNIEIANRLIELRKKNGLSQEELASRLGLSRQAVSKWERAESSPDTDNLICLAKLYGVSLDELLNTDQSAEEIREEVREREEEREKNEKAETTSKAPNQSPEEKKRAKAFDTADAIATGVLFLVATIAYLLVGFLVEDQWGKLWVVFLLPPVLTSVISCVKNRRVSHFLYPLLATIVFLTLGVYADLWHPAWIAFLTIPVFYMIADPIDRATASRRNEPEDPEDTEDEENEEDDD